MIFSFCGMKKEVFARLEDTDEISDIGPPHVFFSHITYTGGLLWA